MTARITLPPPNAKPDTLSAAEYLELAGKSSIRWHLKKCENCGSIWTLPDNPTQSDTRRKTCSKECAAARRANGISKSYTPASLINRSLHHEERQNSLKSGQKFEMLTAIRMDHIRTFPGGSKRAVWLFQCDCGKFVKRFFTDVLRKDQRSASKSCGCTRKGKPASSRLEMGESSFRCLFAGYIKTAKDRKLAWNLTRSEFKFLTSQDCHYCGIEPSQIRKAHKSSFGTYTYNGIDRVDSAAGYSRWNVVPACRTCNMNKNITGEKEFLQWVGRIASHQSRQNIGTNEPLLMG